MQTTPSAAKQPRSSLSFIAAVVAGLIGLPGHVQSDAPPDYQGRVIIEDAWVVPSGKSDGIASLRLRIVNERGDRLQFLGAATPIATSAHIMGRTGNRQTATFRSLSIAPGDALDFTTSHLWIEFRSLTRPLLAGEDLPITLFFIGGRIESTAHVHGPATTSPINAQ